MSSSSFWRLLYRLPSIMYVRRQLLRKMWLIQLVPLLIVCRIFLSSLTSYLISFFTTSVQLIFFILLQHHIWKLSMYFWSAFLIPCLYVYFESMGTEFRLAQNSLWTGISRTSVPSKSGHTSVYVPSVYILDTSRNLCICPSMLAYCYFLILLG